MRLTTVTKRADLLLLTADDFDDVPRSLGTRAPAARVQPEPRRVPPRRRQGARQRPASSRPARRRPATGRRRSAPGRVRPRAAPADAGRRPGRAARARAGRAAGRVDGHSQSLAREFDRVLDVLGRRGYVDAGELVAHRTRLDALAGCSTSPTCWSPSACSAGLLDGARRRRSRRAAVGVRLRAPQSRNRRRRRGSRRADVPPAVAADRRHQRGPRRRRALDRPRRAPPARPGVHRAAHGWVAGEGLADVVADEELTGGDFVRTMKQLIDLARQIALVAPDAADTRRACPRGRRARRSAASSPTVGRSPSR